jgi:hypothetical protein
MRVDDSELPRSPTGVRNRLVAEHIAQSLEQLRISLDLLKHKVPRTWGWVDYRAYVIGSDGHKPAASISNVSMRQPRNEEPSFWQITR